VTAGWVLSPRAARVFYNAADAWIPPAADAPGGGALDLVARLAPHLRAGERRRLERQLRLLEWSPWLALRARSGLCWLAREERRAWLERLEHGGIGPVRRAAARVHALVGLCYADAVRGAAARAPDQSLGGA
jgi:hypothetical protein